MNSIMIASILTSIASTVILKCSCALTFELSNQIQRRHKITILSQL